MSTPPTDEIEPLVPRLFTTDSKPTPDDETRPAHESTTERPPRTDAAPDDRHRERIEPLVPDLR